ncbi:MAG: small ribosomal subunit Rsm22 family protein [Treponema sp.]|jgi:hypothetical protein|nr:small ribosomal subunit Rsm22 family protein [Treponema sp.]
MDSLGENPGNIAAGPIVAPGAVLKSLLGVIEKTFPVPGRFRSSLPRDVAELSRLLTSARSEREDGYLNRPNLLSAYLRYFLPWNVFRLYRLFSLVSGLNETGCLSQENGDLPEGSAGPFPGLTGGDAVTDLGSGPLTLPVALWLFRPELRKIDLEFRCVDHTGSVLEAGRKLFAALEAAESESFRSAWKIRTIRDSINAPVRGEKAALVTAINVFNEVYRRGDPASSAQKALKLLERSGEASFFVMEPGIPESGAFITALRDALLERGKRIAAPCTHEGPCPLPGVYERPGEHGRKNVGPGRGKTKWCHFAFDTAEAPAELHKLSAAAGIPKERATLSFLLAGKAGPGDHPKIRVISDAFPVPGGRGRYGCGKKGPILLKGSRAEIERMTPGTAMEYEENRQAEFDAKTGALIVNVGSVDLSKGGVSNPTANEAALLHV